MKPLKYSENTHNYNQNQNKIIHLFKNTTANEQHND